MPRTNVVHQDGPGHTIFAADVNNVDQYLAQFSRGVYTAAEYGAKGDGSTDDTAAIQAAITAAGNAGNGVVLLCPGVSIITQLQYRNYVTIRGSGKYGSILRQKAGTASPMLVSWDATQRGWMPTFQDFALDASANTASNQGGLCLTGTQSATVQRVLVNYCNAYGVKLAGGSVGGDAMFATIDDCIIQNSGNNCINLWLSPTDASKPDGTKIVHSYINSGNSGNVGIQADRGPTSGQGPEGCYIAGNTLFSTPTFLQWAGNDSAFIKNRWEQFSTFASNIVMNVTQGTYDTHNGRNVFLGNNYTFTGSYGGAEPLLFTDTSTIKSVRLFEGKTPATGGTFDWATHIPYLDIGDKRLFDNGAGVLQLLEQTASTPMQLDLKGGSAGSNANIRLFNLGESNARLWVGYDNSVPAAVIYYGDGTNLDTMLSRTAAGSLRLQANLASTAAQLDLKGSAAGQNANIRLYNGTSEANARAWIGYDHTLGGGAGVLYFGDGTSLDTSLYRNAANQLKSGGGLVLGGPLVLPSYTTAGKPAAASVPAGSVIYVSDGGSGANVQCSTGAAWVNLG